jgi:DNA (cytosine-5)-methyltransferase 1
MKILNLYAGIGGNRKLWSSEHEITAVESEEYIANAYRLMFPKDTVIVGDAHQYLLDHHKEFDFIWSSPPCPTHSKANTSLYGWDVVRYPDMGLYQEIIFLKHFYKGKWVVENVIPYYEPLIKPTITLDRHFFWSNFAIEPFEIKRDYNVARTTKEMLADHHGIVLPDELKNKRKLLRNAVYPPLGEHILASISYPHLFS